MPRVSVIVPCYNQGAYLEEAIESLLAQTYRDFEVIVVNDGSTDEFTNTLLADYRRPFTTVLQTANQGLSAARNHAIRHAVGEYILPLDADDRIAPEYLSMAVEILDREPSVGIVYSLAETFGAKSGKRNLAEFSMSKMLMSNLIFCSAMFRRSDWERAGGYNRNMTSGWEDWDFWLSILELGRTVHRLPKVLFYYRVKTVSMATGLDMQKEIEMHQQIILNHPLLYAANARPLLEIYYRLRHSWPYRILKRSGLIFRMARLWR
jgi:glycosyltransferase involved in cell wall biosynthesis